MNPPDQGLENLVALLAVALILLALLFLSLNDATATALRGTGGETGPQPGLLVVAGASLLALLPGR